MTNEPVGIGQAGLDICWFQPRIPLKDGFRRISSCQHAKDMFDRQPASTDNRFTTEYFRIHRDSLKKNVLIHDTPSLYPYNTLGKQRRKPVRLGKISFITSVYSTSQGSATIFIPSAMPDIRQLASICTPTCQFRHSSSGIHLPSLNRTRPAKTEKKKSLLLQHDGGQEKWGSGEGVWRIGAR